MKIKSLNEIIKDVKQTKEIKNCLNGEEFEAWLKTRKECNPKLASFKEDINE